LIGTELQPSLGGAGGQRPLLEHDATHVDRVPLLVIDDRLTDHAERVGKLLLGHAGPLAGFRHALADRAGNGLLPVGSRPVHAVQVRASTTLGQGVGTGDTPRVSKS
jgi:hypothetical protein